MPQSTQKPKCHLLLYCFMADFPWTITTSHIRECCCLAETYMCFKRCSRGWLCWAGARSGQVIWIFLHDIISIFSLASGEPEEDLKREEDLGSYRMLQCRHPNLQRPISRKCLWHMVLTLVLTGSDCFFHLQMKFAWLHNLGEILYHTREPLSK